MDGKKERQSWGSRQEWSHIPLWVQAMQSELHRRNRKESSSKILQILQIRQIQKNLILQAQTSNEIRPQEDLDSVQFGWEILSKDQTCLKRQVTKAIQIKECWDKEYSQKSLIIDKYMRNSVPDANTNVDPDPQPNPNFPPTISRRTPIHDNQNYICRDNCNHCSFGGW